MASNREERLQMRQRGAGIRKIKEVDFVFAFGLDPTASGQSTTQPPSEQTAAARDATAAAPASALVTDSSPNGERRGSAVLNGLSLQTRNGSVQRTSPRNRRNGAAATRSTPEIHAIEGLEPEPQRKKRKLGRASRSPGAHSSLQARKGDRPASGDRLPNDEITPSIVTATQKETVATSGAALPAGSEIPIASQHDPTQGVEPNSADENHTESLSNAQAELHLGDLVANDEPAGQRRVRRQRTIHESAGPAGADGAAATASTQPSPNGVSRNSGNERPPETSPAAHAKLRRGRPSAQSTASVDVDAGTAGRSQADRRPTKVKPPPKRRGQANPEPTEDAIDKESGPLQTEGKGQNGRRGTRGAEPPSTLNDRASHGEQDRAKSSRQTTDRRSRRRSTKPHEPASAPTPSAPESSREQVPDSGLESRATRPSAADGPLAASEPPRRSRGRPSLAKRSTVDEADQPSPQRDTRPSDSAPPPKRRRGRPSQANRSEDQTVRQEAPASQQEPEKEADDGDRPSKRKPRLRGDTVPVTVHRLANVAGLGGILPSDDSAAEDEVSSDELSTRQKTKLPSRGGVNPADVLSQICRETLEKALSTLHTGISNESNPGRRSEWARKKKAVEAYASELEGRLFELSEILDSNFILGVQMKKAKRRMMDLRGRLQQVRRQREEVALQMDAVRKKHADEEAAKMSRTTINNSLHSLELALDRSRARPGFDDDADRSVDEASTTVGLEFMLRRVAEDVSSSAPGAHGGILQQIKSFNAQLEAAARVLES